MLGEGATCDEYNASSSSSWCVTKQDEVAKATVSKKKGKEEKKTNLSRRVQWVWILEERRVA
jgi:hypothetical protein